MTIWLSLLIFAAFLVYIVVQAIRVGQRERARLERIMAELAGRRCGKCSELYGPPHPNRPQATFIADPKFQNPAYQTYWEVRCPTCRHTVIAGLANDAEILVVLTPAELDAGRKGKGDGKGKNDFLRSHED